MSGGDKPVYVGDYVNGKREGKGILLVRLRNWIEKVQF